MKYYILRMSALESTFSIVDSGREIRYRYNNATTSEVFGDVEEEDLVLGYSTRDSRVKYLFEVVQNENGSELTLRKKLDVEVGAQLLDDTASNVEHNEILEITEDDYKKIYKLVLQSLDAMDEVDENSQEKRKTLNYKTNVISKYKRNRIIFGAPGTGKSFKLNQDAEEFLGKDSSTNVERVTFHPDYSYAGFVGTYKPIMIKNEAINKNLDDEKRKVIATLTDEGITAQEKYDLLYDKFRGDGLTRLPLLLGLYTDETFTTRKEDGTEAVGNNSVERNHGRAIRPYVNIDNTCTIKKGLSYQFVPGPFMRVLAKALKNAMTDNPKPYLLIIEEINRAEAAAVFGDVFQLLDRNKYGISEYAISTSDDVRAYLAEELNVDESCVETIKIPDNMFIWATMNSADQGVYPMDTAFKRRWDFTYLGIDDAVKTFSPEIFGKKYTLGKGKYARLVSWNDLRIAINDLLSSENFNINEDKLLGPYFISKNVLENDDEEEFINVFKHKVLMYLFDDAIKQKRKSFFEECNSDGKGMRYSVICDTFDEKGVFIFQAVISDTFDEIPKTMEEDKS